MLTALILAVAIFAAIPVSTHNIGAASARNTIVCPVALPKRMALATGVANAKLEKSPGMHVIIMTVRNARTWGGRTQWISTIAKIKQPKDKSIGSV